MATSKRHESAWAHAKAWRSTRREVAYGVAVAVLTAIAEKAAQQSITLLTIGAPVVAGLLAAFAIPAVVYALFWLTAPHRMILGELEALRAAITDLRELPPPPPTGAVRPTPEPVTINPTLALETTGGRCRVSVLNPGPKDCFFEALIWLIDGTSESFYYPLPVKWASAKDAALLIPRAETRYLELAEIYGGAYDMVVRFPQPNDGSTTAPIFENHLPAPTVSLRVTPKGSDVRGRADMTIKLRLVDAETSEGQIPILIEPEEVK